MHCLYLIFPSIVAISLFLCTPSFSQQGNFRNYSVNDGLAQSQVYTICESPDGHLWTGTRGGGLCRFDGVEFETFTKKQGLPNNYITTMCKTGDGKIWVGTNEGLCLLLNNTITPINSSLINENTIIQAILEDSQGHLWVGTNQGLLYRPDSIFKKIEIPEISSAYEVTSLTEGDSSTLWIGTNRGLINLRGNKVELYTVSDGLTSNYIKALQYDSQRRLWIGTYGKGMCFLNKNKEITSPTYLKRLQNAVVHSLFKDSKDNMWVSTQTKGLVKWSITDSSLSYFMESDGLANNHVRCVYEDRWGNIWIGTSGGGISKFFGQPFEHYSTTSSRLKSNYIYAIEASNDSDVWVSTSGLGVNRLFKETSHYYGVDSGFVNAKVKTIYKSSNGNIWFGTEGKGLYLFDWKVFSSYDFNKNLKSLWVKDIKEDLDGNIWVATFGGGVVKIISDGSQFSYTRINKSIGLKNNRISALHIDKSNRVWFAYQTGGIGIINHDTLLTVETEAINQSIRSATIWSMAEDNYGKLWLGTSGKGVYRLDLYTNDWKINNLSSEDILISDNIYLLGVDHEENVWVGSEKGVEKIRLNEEGNILQVSSYGIDEGFKGIETSRNAISLDSSGGVWIGTIDGLFKYNRNYKNENKKPPTLRIKDISLSYVSISETLYAEFKKEIPKNPNAQLLLKYNQNHLTFDFQGILLTKPDQVRYKWQLEGLEEDWSPVSNKTSITYSNLSPGKYLFKVISRNEDGVWNEKPEQVPFEILAPLWYKAWFIIISITVVLLIIALFVWMRIQTIRKKAENAHKLLQIQNEVLVLEQKALRLQMNPHFIFNCLNTIQSMIVKKDAKTARYFLSKFSKLMRKALDNSREQLILLADEIDMLENYLSLEKFCSEDHFDYSIHVDKNLAPDFLEIPPMLIQPFAENAIVHGVAHREKGGYIRVDFSQHKNYLICTIEDNGVGREKARKLSAPHIKDHKSTALLITQERLSYLEHGISDSELIISDILDENSKCRGTKVTLKIVMDD